MAIVRAYGAIDMTGESGSTTVGYVEEASSTRIIIKAGYVKDAYYGNFVYGYYSDEVYGSLDSYIGSYFDQVFLKITEIYADAYIASSFIFDFDLFGFQSYIYSSNDTMLGSRQADTIIGFSGNDWIAGNGGSDRLFGEDGSDRLLGGNGNDLLDGGEGADLMQGGVGNDTYYVDSAADRVAEAPGQGIDVVFTSVHHALRVNVENLTLLGQAAINGTGNGIANVISGNSASNVLTGGAGNDRIVAGAGNDRIVAGTGTDQVAGGRDADVFLFRDLRDCGNGSLRDVILDFRPGQDILHLAAIDANYRADGNQAFVFLGAGDFTGNAGEVRYDFSGILSGDVNGDGVSDFQLEFTNNAVISAADILL